LKEDSPQRTQRAQRKEGGRKKEGKKGERKKEGKNGKGERLKVVLPGRGFC
jgi:hypothetical protein